MVDLSQNTVLGCEHSSTTEPSRNHSCEGLLDVGMMKADISSALESDVVFTMEVPTVKITRRVVEKDTSVAEGHISDAGVQRGEGPSALLLRESGLDHGLITRADDIHTLVKQLVTATDKDERSVALSGWSASQCASLMHLATGLSHVSTAKKKMAARQQAN